VTLGRGVVVAAGAIINPATHIGDHAILNTAASVDHDCTVERFVHIAPGTHLAGTIYVGEGAFLGTGVSVIPSRRIGVWSIVGAGAVVTRDVPDRCTVVGIPARIIDELPSATIAD
jgi:UDP-perosamine 4-acetyltransferase